MSRERELYKLYPRHVAQRVAEVAIAKALARLDNGTERLDLIERNNALQLYRDGFTFLKQAVECYASSPAGKRDSFTPHPSTWFNQSRYLDDPGEWFRLGDRGKLAATEGLRYG